MGDRRPWALLAAVALILAACNDATPDPTLATGTTAPPTTTTTSTTTTTTSTTTAAPTTTQNPDARFREIEELAQATIVGRFVAIHDKDPEALAEVIGSQKLYDSAIDAMEQTVFLEPPADSNVDFAIKEVLLDRDDCVSASFSLDTHVIFAEALEPTELVGIWWPEPDGPFLLGAIWQQNTPETVWIEECDIAIRGITS